MRSFSQYLSPSEAAKQLGISAKTLRIYEQHGLITPPRTDAGWRIYGPNEMTRAGEIVALRELGLSLSQVAKVRGGDAQILEPALGAHQESLEGELRTITATLEKVRRLRSDLAKGQAPEPQELGQLLKPLNDQGVSFELPWPWGGEQFELRDIRALNYIIGPLGSGKTRFAKRIAEVLPGATFLGLERVAAAARTQLDANPAAKLSVNKTLDKLVKDGATESDSLVALLTALESKGPAALVIDMLEQNLDKGTQEALISYLRHRAPGARPLFFLTRSNAILNLDAIGADEAIILCPANHSPPTRVEPYPGAPGYDSVATCLAAPEVRARTEGVSVWRPPHKPANETTSQLSQR